MAVVLTEKAANEFKRIIEGNQNQLEPGAMLRVGVTGGGCSGFSYSLDFALPSVEAGSKRKFDATLDSKYEYHGVSVIVDKKSALFLDGTTIDFYEGLDRRGFQFDNPNAVKTCGCGSSFQA
jgi:iron-sulfur cluster assembly protein